MKLHRSMRYLLVFIALIVGIKLITMVAVPTDDSHTFGNPVTKQDVIKIPAPPEKMTQSEAHMSVPAIRKTVESWYFLNDNKPLQQLWERVVAKEREFNDKYYVFYHGLSSAWRVPQDLFLELYKLFHPITMAIINYRALRWVVPLDVKSPAEWLKQEMKEYGQVNDNEARLKAFLLSTNLALFGNTGFPGECTMEYILDEKSNTTVGEWAFTSILDLFGATHEYVPQLMTLAAKYLQANLELHVRDSITNKDGWERRPVQTLCQIFIPKEIVDSIAYISWVQGVPYEEKLVAWVKGEVDPKIGKHAPYTITQQTLGDIRKLFKDKQEGHPIFNQILTGIEQGKYRISTMLNSYKTEPQYLGSLLNEIQGRLIVTPSGLGSISGGAQIFDYDFIPEKKKEAYRRELKEFANKIFKQRLQRAAQAPKSVDNLARAFKDLSSSKSRPAARGTRQERRYY